MPSINAASALSQRFTSPSPLCGDHKILEFRSRDVTMERWFHERALPAQYERNGLTFVVSDSEGAVAGFYQLSVGLVDTGTQRSAAVVLNRLAVDTRFEGDLALDLLSEAIHQAKMLPECSTGKLLIVTDLNSSIDMGAFGFERSEVGGFNFLSLHDGE
jgi:hypothetical protein